MKRGAVQLAAGAVLFVVGAVLVAWLIGGSSKSTNFERPGPSEATGESDAAEPQQPALAGATVDDGTWGLAPGESKREAAPASTGTRIAARLSDLLSPQRAGSREALVDYRVAMIASDGTRRDVRPDDPVDVQDIASGGLWIIEADGLCARWLASGEVLKWSSLGHEGPLALELSPWATVAVHVEATPPGRVPIEAIELTAEHPDNHHFLAHRRRNGDVPPANRERRLEVFAGLRELLDPACTNQRRRAVLDALFSHPELARTVDGQSLTEYRALAPWCERRVDSPFEPTTIFERVPSVAAVEIEIVCNDVLAVDRHRRDDHEQLVLRGRMRTDRLPLETGGVVEVGVAYQVYGRVTGRLPDDALPPAKFTLLHRYPSEAESGTVMRQALGVEPRLDDANAFTWPALPPGNYVMNAEWGGPERHLNFVEREFDLAAGQTFDLGVLFAPLDGALTILPRFVDRNGAPFVSPLPPERVLVSMGSIAIDTKGAWSSSQSIALEFENGVPLLLRGLDPADYVVNGGWLVVRDAADPPFSRGTGRDQFRIVDSTIHGSKVSVPAQDFVEVGMRIETLGLVTFELELDAVVEASALSVEAQFFGGVAGEERRSTTAFEVRKGPGGTTIVEVPIDLVFGQWRGRFVVGVARAGASKAWYTAQQDFVVGSIDEAVLPSPLEPAAALRLATARLDGQRREPVKIADEPRGFDVHAVAASAGTDGQTVYEALFPRTEYLVLGSQRVTTGEPGSVVDVP